VSADVADPECVEHDPPPTLLIPNSMPSLNNRDNLPHALAGPEAIKEKMNSQATQSLLSTPMRKRNKVVSAVEAVRLIHDGDAVAVGCFVGGGAPEALLVALGKQFLNTGKPRNLTLVYAADQATAVSAGSIISRSRG
jgi:hypothetical protein